MNFQRQTQHMPTYAFLMNLIEQKHNIVIVAEFSAITLATFSLFIAIAVPLRREL